MTKKSTYLIQQLMTLHPSKRVLWQDYEYFTFKEWRDLYFKKLKLKHKHKTQYRRIARVTKSTIHDTVED